MGFIIEEIIDKDRIKKSRTCITNSCKNLAGLEDEIYPASEAFFPAILCLS
jgi:hypothetical protein